MFHGFWTIINHHKHSGSVPVTVQIDFLWWIFLVVLRHTRQRTQKNNQIVDDDQRGVLTFCDGHIPSFNPINFNEK